MIEPQPSSTKYNKYILEIEAFFSEDSSQTPAILIEFVNVFTFPAAVMCQHVGPSGRNIKVTVERQRRRLEEAAFTHTHTQDYLSMCPGLLGGQWQQMVCNSSHCLRMWQQGLRHVLFGPGLGDAIAMSCISVTFNLFPIIKASPSGST